MGSYEITRTLRETCEHGDHIGQVSVGRLMPPTQVIDVSVALLMVTSGDIVYLRSPESGERLAVRKWRCGCGKKTIEVERASIRPIRYADIRDRGPMAEGRERDPAPITQRG